MNRSAIYVRNFVFGVEDSLVSTVGLLSGIAIAGVPKSTIILTGTVLIFVEALSMGVGSFLSEHTVQEAERASSRLTDIESRSGGLIMFLSYFLAGFIPLAPYAFLDPMHAFWASISLSLLSLFALGIISGKAFRISVFSNGIRMLLLGGAAILIGVLVGTLVPS